MPTVELKLAFRRNNMSEPYYILPVSYRIPGNIIVPREWQDDHEYLQQELADDDKSEKII